MVVSVNVQLTPVGETESVRVIVPVKWFTGATVTVELAEVPGLTLTLVGAAVTIKSVTTTVTLTE